MNMQTIIDAIRAWLANHGIITAVIVAVALIALKVAAALNRKLVAKGFKGREDADSQSLAQSVVAAVHWVLSILIVAVAVVLILADPSVVDALVKGKQ